MLDDILIEMFNESFVAEMFERDQLPNMISLKQLFVKLAHSSIMRLNEISMSKVSQSFDFLFNQILTLD